MTETVLEKELVMTQEVFDAFARLSGDDNPIHVDSEFAAKTDFGQTVAHGMYLYAILREMVRELSEGTPQFSQSLMFPAPARCGDKIKFIVNGIDSSVPTYKMQAVRMNDGEEVCRAECSLLPEMAF